MDTIAAALATPVPVAPKKLPSAGGSVKVQPLLSPDNYAARVTALIKSARGPIVPPVYLHGDGTHTDKLLGMVEPATGAG